MAEYWNSGMMNEQTWLRQPLELTVPTILLALLLLSGCTTYDAQVRVVRNHYLSGNYEAAQQLTAKKVESSGDSGYDALIWQLENAAILRTAGKFPESSQAFEQARTLYTKYLDEAKIKIVRGGAAMLTTPANLPYYGTGYDGIMIDTYQTLNALQLGKLDHTLLSVAAGDCPGQCRPDCKGEGGAGQECQCPAFDRTEQGADGNDRYLRL
jgi:hypothetical protein